MDFKGGGKRGHNVSDTNVSLFARARNIVCPRHKNVSDFFQKHFGSANVSPFARPRKRYEQQCVCSNVSSFATALKVLINQNILAILKEKMTC